jgi:hypothetical protein
MRNFLPIGLFATAASVAIFGTPSFHAEHFTVKANSFAVQNALERSGPRLEDGNQLGERDDMRFFVPRCDRQSPCAIRRPMT